MVPFGRNPRAKSYPRTRQPTVYCGDTARAMPTLVLVDHVRFIWPNRRCRIERSSSIIGRASRITDRLVYPTERRDAFNVFDGNVYRFPGQLRRSRSQYIPYVCNGKSVGECTGRGDYTRRARGRSTRGHFTGRIVVRSYPTSVCRRISITRRQ